MNYRMSLFMLVNLLVITPAYMAMDKIGAYKQRNIHNRFKNSNVRINTKSTPTKQTRITKPVNRPQGRP